MARHSYNIANGTGAAVREELNKALAAIQSVNSGSGSPSPATAYQYFIDESATPALIKQRNAANDGDILLGESMGKRIFLTARNQNLVFHLGMILTLGCAAMLLTS